MAAADPPPEPEIEPVASMDSTSSGIRNDQHQKISAALCKSYFTPFKRFLDTPRDRWCGGAESLWGWRKPLTIPANRSYAVDTDSEIGLMMKVLMKPHNQISPWEHVSSL
jgi:hypothetical protein